jgi:hypothetical protein
VLATLLNILLYAEDASFCDMALVVVAGCLCPPPLPFLPANTTEILQSFD